MASIPTVAISNEDGSDYLVINRADYDPEIHRLWEDSEPEPSFHSYSDADLEEPEPVAVVDQVEPEPEPVAVVDQDAELTARAEELADQKTMTELKAMAKELGISGYSKMNQADITMAIARAEADGS